MTVSRRVAFCGILSALALVWLMFTAFPFGTIALTALAGLMIAPAGLELGSRYGWACYGVTAILAVLIVPSVTAKALYVLFFGYYPLIQLRVNLWERAVFRWVTKLVLFNAVLAMALAVGFALNTPGDLIVEHPWLIVLATPVANAVFLLYDYAIWPMIGMYRVRLHPIINKFLR